MIRLHLWLALRICLAAACVLAAGSCPAQHARQQQHHPAGGASGPGPAAAQPLYLVTAAPLKLILDPLVQGRAQVAVLLPAGASAHTYEPRPSDAQAAARATALFWIGEEFDGFAAGLQARASVELLPLLPAAARLQGVAHEHGADAHDEHGHGAAADAQHGTDPHFFTDPLTVQALLPALASELSRLDPNGAVQYKTNALAFSTELDAVHAEAGALLRPAAGQATLLFHPSFCYMFRRYGIELAGVIEEFPGKEPSPRDLQELVEVVKARRIRAIFSETLLPKQPAQAVAEATGVPVFELDPGCGNVNAGYTSYKTWLLYNAQILHDALSDEPGA